VTRHTRRASRDPRFTEDDVRIGHVNGVFGLRGDVRLYLYNPASDFVGAEFDAWLVAPDGTRQEIRIWVRPGSGRRILGAIEGIGTPEAARALKDYELVVPTDYLEADTPGEWYHRDLLGSPVTTESGTALGTIKDIVEGPGMDTWVIRGASGEVWVHVRLEDLLEVAPPDRIVVRDSAVLRLSDAE